MEIHYEPNERLIANYIPGFVPGKKKAWSQVRICGCGAVLTRQFARRGLDVDSTEPGRSTITPKRVESLCRRALELIEVSRGKLPICDDVEGRSITIQAEDGSIESVTLYGGGGGVAKHIKKDFDALWNDIAACTNKSEQDGAGQPATRSESK